MAAEHQLGFAASSNPPVLCSQIHTCVWFIVKNKSYETNLGYTNIPVYLLFDCNSILKATMV